MIIKIADFYYDTILSEARAIIFIDKCIRQHLDGGDELDIEHLLDLIEENDDFESAPDENDFEVEITLSELENKVEDILVEIEESNDSAHDDDAEDDAYGVGYAAEEDY